LELAGSHPRTASDWPLWTRVAIPLLAALPDGASFLMFCWFAMLNAIGLATLLYSPVLLLARRSKDAPA